MARRYDTEMTTWLEGPRFGLFFQEYAKAWIYPEQVKIRETGGQTWWTMILRNGWTPLYEGTLQTVQQSYQALINI